MLEIFLTRTICNLQYFNLSKGITNNLTKYNWWLLATQFSFLPHTILIISIDKQLRTNTAATALWLAAKLKVLHETVVDELSLNVTTAVQWGTVLSPADTLSSHTPLSGSHTTGTQSLNIVYSHVCGCGWLFVCKSVYVTSTHTDQYSQVYVHTYCLFVQTHNEQHALHDTLFTSLYNKGNYSVNFQ